MKTVDCEFQTDFDLMDPAYLAGPPYASLSTGKRTQKIHEIVRKRCVTFRHTSYQYSN